jgi:hypothetical protein
LDCHIYPRRQEHSTEQPPLLWVIGLFWQLVCLACSRTCFSGRLSVSLVACTTPHMISAAFHSTMQRWASIARLGALTSRESGRHEWIFPLRDETGVIYQISVYGRCFGLVSRIYTSEYVFDGAGRITLSKQRVSTALLLSLAGELDRALSIVNGWMTEHGASKLQMNQSEMRREGEGNSR